MADSSIPLAKGMDLSKMDWPAFLSIKYDGVPVKMTFIVTHNDCTWDVVTRQGKPCPSIHQYVQRIADDLALEHNPAVITIIAEVTHETLNNFKDVSGVVRKKAPQDQLLFNVFDFAVEGHETDEFHTRIEAGARLVRWMAFPWLRPVIQLPVVDQDAAEGLIALMQEHHPDEEGFILRSQGAAFKPGSRHWNYQKIVVDPTADLKVVGFEEAVSKDGEPLGMVGRVNVEYNGEIIGCGPGKLTHTERVDLWKGWLTRPCGSTQHGVDLPAIATIKYKRDDSYGSLRQPTFQHWRPERTDTST